MKQEKALLKKRRRASSHAFTLPNSEPIETLNFEGRKKRESMQNEVFSEVSLSMVVSHVPILGSARALNPVEYVSLIKLLFNCVDFSLKENFNSVNY